MELISNPCKSRTQQCLLILRHRKDQMKREGNVCSNVSVRDICPIGRDRNVTKEEKTWKKIKSVFLIEHIGRRYKWIWCRRITEWGLSLKTPPADTRSELLAGDDAAAAWSLTLHPPNYALDLTTQTPEPWVTDREPPGSRPIAMPGGRC